MPVGVVQADGDQRQPWTCRAQQAHVLMGGAVVGDFEHIDRRKRRVGRQQTALGRRFQVSEQEQRRSVGDTDQQGDTGIVGSFRPARLAGRPAAVGIHPLRELAQARPEHLPGQRPDLPSLAHPGADHGHLRLRCHPADSGALLARLLQCGCLHHPHRPAPEHTGQPTDMVRVKVGQEYQRNAGDAQIAEAVVDRSGVGPGVDDHSSSSAGRQHHGIPLSHIAEGDRPTGRRPSGDHPGERSRTDHGQYQQPRADGGRPRMVSQSPESEHGQGGGRRQEQSAPPAGLPGHLCSRQ